ncbi:carbohydrate-binding module family 18 protein [Zopfia rhizophila CBS 207.26]|uniref:chitinase n=1 Tax=Zopfia rhizophila CBS 207.26 TaxID=1314779 RepID=A0A6A6ENJ2_9PEZI|nr:carbohydrate-binding module family 18 protein [Zopfia rhizophila CBS 207.26]
MPSSTFFRAAAIAGGLFVSTASAAFSAGSSSNVAVYWGQGNAQIPLSKLCNDDSVDIINIAFIRWPTNYYLETKEIAEYFAEFLWGAFGPQTQEWVDAGKPRPFGDASVDGFDLDIESWMETPPFEGYESKNYGALVSCLKNTLYPTGPGAYYISGAPQCVIPDARLADAISTSSFDFIFMQFYNTLQCSSRAGYNGLKTASSTFTAKIYLGFPANSNGAPSDPTSYLNPTEANDLISYYKEKHPDAFGGVMLWEATVSTRNQICSKSYSAWIKDILAGKFNGACTSSSSSSSIASSTSSSSVISTPTATSPDGTCGGTTGYTCIGYHMGECCSQLGFCGGNPIYCDAGCQSLFGRCGSSSSSISISSTSSYVSSTSSSVPLSSHDSTTVYPSSSSSSYIPYPTGNSSNIIYPTGYPTSSSMDLYPGSTSSHDSISTPCTTSGYDYQTSVPSYPSKGSYGSSSIYSYPRSSSAIYPTEVYPSQGASSTPCSTSGSHSTPAAYYPSSPVYPSEGSYESSSAYPYPTYPVVIIKSSTRDVVSTPCTTTANKYPSSPVYPSSSVYLSSPAYSSERSYDGSSAVPYYSHESSSWAPYPAYPRSATYPSSVTTTVITTSYVDICPEATASSTGVPEAWPPQDRIRCSNKQGGLSSSSLQRTFVPFAQGHRVRSSSSPICSGLQSQ